MIEVFDIRVRGWEMAIKGMRNPMSIYGGENNSWDKADSTFFEDRIIELGPNDLDLACRLVKSGPEHRKFLRMIHVQMNILAPMYWFMEFDQYKIATTTSGTSKMHRLLKKPFELSDFSFDIITKTEEEQKNKYFDVEFTGTLESKPIEGFDDYIIWNNGVVERINFTHHNQKKYIQPCVNSSNYKKVVLKDNEGKAKNCYIHRLVANAFIPNPDNKPEVNHKDGNKWNNNLENLEWATKQENALHAFDMGLRTITSYNKHRVSKTTRRFDEKEIKEIHRLFEEEKMTKKEIAKIFNCSDSIICNILNGKTYKQIELTSYDMIKVIIDSLNELREKFLKTKDMKYWYAVLELLPNSYNQFRTVDFSYETALNIVNQRHNHKLDEWRKFADILLTELPYLNTFYEAMKGDNQA